jgi:hypothetical protein
MEEAPKVVQKTKFNAYDSKDIVRREAMIRANGMKIAAYRVFDPELGKHSKLQFHMTTGDTVMAIMGEEAAKMFSWFVSRTMGEDTSGSGNPLQPVAPQLDVEDFTSQVTTDRPVLNS